MMQKINLFNVSIINGNFNIEIEGIVGAGAYIEIFAKDAELVQFEGLTYYYLQSFFNYELISNETDNFSTMKVTGKNWFDKAASFGMKIVIWDSTPDNHTSRALFICRIPDYIKGDLQIVDGFSGLSPNKKAHKTYLSSFKVFINNTNWNIEVSGNLTTKGWIGLYQAGNKDSRTDWSWTKSLSGGTREVVHKETSFIVLAMSKQLQWFNDSANTDCYFKIFDKLFDMYNDNPPEDWAEVKERAIFYIPEVIETEIEVNYY